MKYVKLFFSYRALQFEKRGFEKNALLIGASESGGRTWRDKKIHDFHNFSNSGLKFHMRISECIWNRIMMKKKYRFFDPFTGEAPLKISSIFYKPTKLQKIQKIDFFSKLCQKYKFQYFLWILIYTIAIDPQIKMLFRFLFSDE